MPPILTVCMSISSSPRKRCLVNDSDVKVQMGMPVTKPDRGQIQTYRLALKDSRDQKNPDVLGARNGKLYFNRNGKITLIFSQCEPDQESELKRVWDIWLDERPRQEK